MKTAIIVRPGIYVENIDFTGKAITVKSGSGPAATVIDGGEPDDPLYTSVAVFKSGEGPDSRLQGFTLTNGSGSLGHGGHLHGGGIANNQTFLNLVNCTVVENTAGQLDGGMYSFLSTLWISNSTFSQHRRRSRVLQNRGRGLPPYFQALHGPMGNANTKLTNLLTVRVE